MVITGRLTELPTCTEYLVAEVKKGAMWGRFGEILCHTAPHRRAAGLVAAGIDRLVVPTGKDNGRLFSPFSGAAAT